MLPSTAEHMDKATKAQTHLSSQASCLAHPSKITEKRLIPSLSIQLKQQQLKLGANHR